MQPNYTFHHRKRNTEEQHVLQHVIRSYSNLLYQVIVFVLEKFTYFSNIREVGEYTETSHNLFGNFFTALETQAIPF